MGAVTVLLPELEKLGKTLRSNLENFEIKIAVCVPVYMGCSVISVFPIYLFSPFLLNSKASPSLLVRSLSAVKKPRS